MIYPLIGYAPDIDQTTPGVITDCNAIIPTFKGLKAAPGANDGGIDALASTCFGAASLRDLDNSIRTFAGVATKIYEQSGSSWVDVSGSAYNAAIDQPWRFAQFGNVALASNKGDAIQASATGNFAAISGAPKAAVIETVNQFVFALNINDGADKPNGYACCALGDYTDWVESVATQSISGTLDTTPGPISAGKRFGSNLVVYKAESVFLFRYAGAPTVWDIEEIPGSVGAVSQEAVVSVGTPEHPEHIFWGKNDIYRYDGSRPIPIGSPIRETVFGELSQLYASRVKTIHDPINTLVYFFYPTSLGTIDKCVVYNYKTDKWGRDNRTIEAAFDYVSPGISWDTIDTYYPTWDSITDVSWDSPFWTAQNVTPAVFNASHQIQTLDGISGSWYITTGDYGDNNTFSLLDRVKPKYLTANANVTMTNYYRDDQGVSLTSDITTNQSSYRFDVLRSSRWHRFMFNGSGAMEMNAIDVSFQADGDE